MQVSSIARGEHEGRPLCHSCQSGFIDTMASVPGCGVVSAYISATMGYQGCGTIVGSELSMSVPLPDGQTQDLAPTC